jgi:hypothetical protein
MAQALWEPTEDLQIKKLIVGGTWQKKARTGVTVDTIDRSNLALDLNVPYPIPLDQWRKTDSNYGVSLAATAANTLGYTSGAFGVGSPYVQTENEDDNDSAVSHQARCGFGLPPEYADGEAVKMRFFAGMITTVADVTATIDIQVVESNKAAGGGGADLCATAATTINSLTFATVDFTITSADLIAGDLLDIEVTIAINDATATSTNVIGAFGYSAMLLSIRG